MRDVAQEGESVGIGEWHEVNKRGRWDRAKVGGGKRRRQDEAVGGEKSRKSEHGHDCSNSRCSTSRVRTRQRQGTLRGVWFNDNGGSLGDSGAGEKGSNSSWGGPSKDRKGDG